MKYIYLIPFFLFLIACQKDDEVISNSSEVPTIIPNGDEAYLNLNSDYVFDQSTLNTYELIIPESNYLNINSRPAFEEYVEGSLVFQGDTISPVGIRYKGSIGAFVGCLSGNNFANPTGSKTCTKLSMKIKINWEGREDRFFGLRKLQFHSQNNDPSQMRERLGYHLFRSMGVPAPRSVHARLIINGEYSGLYALTEQIDGRFTRYNYDDGTGNLYKEIWPLKMSGMPFSESEYLARLKTNEDENPIAEHILSFAEEVSTASTNELQNIITDRMDINEIMAYCVVDRLIRHDDGPFHWYCNDGPCTSHNFYWYENPTTKKLHLIPWDMDNAFDNIINDSNPITPIADGWGETTNNCNPFPYGFWNIQQWSASCDKLTKAWTSFETEYNTLKSNCINGPMSQANVDVLLTTWSEQIRNATEEAMELHDDAISIPQWEGAMNDLQEQLEFARNN